MQNNFKTVDKANNFKPGDKVICINIPINSKLIISALYTIYDANNIYVRLIEDDNKGYYRYSRFKPDIKSNRKLKLKKINE